MGSNGKNNSNHGYEPATPIPPKKPIRIGATILVVLMCAASALFFVSLFANL